MLLRENVGMTWRETTRVSAAQAGMSPVLATSLVHGDSAEGDITMRRLTFGMLSAFALLLAVSALSGVGTVQAQGNGVNIDLRVSICEAVVNGTPVDCTAIRFDQPQPSLNVLVDAQPYAGSPVPITDTVFGTTLNVPVDSTLEISVASNIPEGYAPAAGYDPLVIAAADVPLGGCGGENLCPVIEMILVRTDGAVDGTTSLQILARNCEDAPADPFDQQEGCVPAVGAFFNAYAASGEFLDNCEAEVDTSESGPSFPIFAECSVEVPYGSTGVVIEDPASIPSYVPVTNPMSFFTPGSTAVPPDSYVGPVFVNVLQAGTDDGSVVTDLPDTGAGPAATSPGSMLLVTALSALAGVLCVATLRIRHQP